MTFQEHWKRTVKTTIQTLAEALATAILAKATAEEEIESILATAVGAGIPEKEFRSATADALVATGRVSSKRAAYNAIARVIGNAFKKTTAPAPTGSAPKGLTPKQADLATRIRKLLKGLKPAARKAIIKAVLA
jgi:hypothetical protein